VDLRINLFEAIDQSTRVGGSQRRIPGELAFSLGLVFPFRCLSRIRKQKTCDGDNPRKTRKFIHPITEESWRGWFEACPANRFDASPLKNPCCLRNVRT